MQYNWTLNVDNFTFFDRLKICYFILNKSNRWTQGNLVYQFEVAMADFVGSKYAVYCSSGSTANTMIAMYLADKEKDKNIVVFPSTTWATSVSPFIREGFLPKFIDVSLEDLCINYDLLEDFVSKNKDNIAAIFPTSLLGFVPDIARLKNISETYGVRLMFDNCENTFGTFEGKNVSSFATSTTSTYFGHHLQSVEGGFVFTNDLEEYEYFLMLRNHGMTRSVTNNTKYANLDVDPRFDFYCIGNNFRNSEIHALTGLLDLKKADKHIETRKILYSLFETYLSDLYYLPPFDEKKEHVAFALPIIPIEQEKKQAAINYCNSKGIETRPIISGNLLRQTCFKQFGSYVDYPNSEFLHHNGFYVGLHTKLKNFDVRNLAKNLSTI
jgi:CDP-6-deoxy-D-xylo-4-hexulose-3-dehydrase